uniref:Uncharacterized protein n=1 Tax=Arundo donax TaxID=35708 RepID=A0A0A9F1A4_ARUDO
MADVQAMFFTCISRVPRLIMLLKLLHGWYWHVCSVCQYSGGPGAGDNNSLGH